MVITEENLIGDLSSKPGRGCLFHLELMLLGKAKIHLSPLHLWYDIELSRIYTPMFTLIQSARSTCSRKFWKNRIQDSLVPEKKIVSRQNEFDSFGNLTGQNSHVSILLTTSARFEFVPRQNKFCVWSRSRD